MFLIITRDTMFFTAMKNVGDLMQRLQKMMPAHIKPAFKTGEGGADGRADG